MKSPKNIPVQYIFAQANGRNVNHVINAGMSTLSARVAGTFKRDISRQGTILGTEWVFSHQESNTLCSTLSHHPFE